MHLAYIYIPEGTLEDWPIIQYIISKGYIDLDNALNAILGSNANWCDDMCNIENALIYKIVSGDKILKTLKIMHEYAKKRDESLLCNHSEIYDDNFVKSVFLMEQLNKIVIDRVGFDYRDSNKDEEDAKEPDVYKAFENTSLYGPSALIHKNETYNKEMYNHGYKICLYDDAGMVLASKAENNKIYIEILQVSGGLWGEFTTTTLFRSEEIGKKYIEKLNNAVDKYVEIYNKLRGI